MPFSVLIPSMYSTLFLKTNSWMHAMIEQVFLSDHVADVHSDSSAPRQIFRNRLEVEPVHVSICIRVTVKIEVVL